MSVNRLVMVRKTEDFTPQLPGGIKSSSIRSLTPSDGQLLGALMYAAYLGTIDYEGESMVETIAEAEATLSSKYGNVIFDASFITVDDDANGIATGASVITDYSKLGPLLAFSVTHPDFQKRGLAACLIKKSLSSLHRLGIPQLSLVVTEQNTGAVRLYDRLGFATQPSPARAEGG